MKFEMTRCNQCGSDMLMAVIICPGCGKQQSGIGKPSPYQPRKLLAIGLAAAVPSRL
jgi:rRNA maturation protein Nop10